MNRPTRIALLAVAAILILVVGGAAVLLATFDANSLKPRIVEAVHRATGRDLIVAGDVHLRPSLWPTVDIADVSLSNPPGFSRPQMATLKHLRASISLLPLLSREIEIGSLTLLQPDILLERNSAGVANWQMAPVAEPPTGASAPEASAAPRKPLLIGVRTVNLQDGTIGFRDDKSGQAGSLGVATLTASAASPRSPTHIEGTGSYNKLPVTFTMDTGGLDRLQGQRDSTPWPLKLSLAIASATVMADGSLTRPEQGWGYDFAVKGTVPDTAALSSMAPGVRVPSVRDVSFAASVLDGGQGKPTVTALSLRAGAGDLGNGVVLSKLDLSGPAMDQPLKLDAAATVNGAPVTAVGTVGSPLQSPVPFDLALRVADNPLTAKGRLTPATGGFGNGAAVQSLAIDGPLLTAAGDVNVALRPRTAVAGTLNAAHVDFDALLAIADKLETPAAASPAGTPQAPSPAPATERRERSDLIFPDTPLPLGQLRDADADLHLAIGTLRTGGRDYRKIETHLILAGGKLAVDPLTGDLPQGHMEGALSIDANQATPPVRLRLRAPGLALRPLLEMMRQPPIASGNLEVYADLSGSGASPHAIASTLNGSLGLAMQGGTIENRLLGSILGRVMNQINALDLVGRGGNSELRCFGARLDMHDGVATVRALDLSSALATVTGSGTINLGAETLDMTLRPEARIGGSTIIIPVQLTGPLRRPSARVNEVKSVEANAPTVAEALIGNATPLGALGGLLGAGRLLGGGGGDACPAALAAARGQAPPAEPSGRPKPPDALPKLPIPNLPDASRTLRNLFR